VQLGRSDARFVDDQDRVKPQLGEIGGLPGHGRGKPRRDLPRETAQRSSASGGLKGHRERDRTGDLQLHQPMSRRIPRQFQNERIPHRRQLAVAIRRPAAPPGISPEPLGDHVTVGARQLRTERQLVRAQHVRCGVSGPAERQAAYPRG
jgi:hypothetical protein